MQRGFCLNISREPRRCQGRPPPSHSTLIFKVFFNTFFQVQNPNYNDESKRAPSIYDKINNISVNKGRREAKKSNDIQSKIVKEHRGSEVTITIYQFLLKSFKQISEERRFKNRSLTGNFYSLNLALYFNRVKPHQKELP